MIEESIPARLRVQLLGVPIRDFVLLQAYFDDMVRELQLIAVGSGGEGAAGRLADVAIFVQHDIAGHRNALHAEAEGAASAGASHVDLSLDLLAASAGDARRLLEVTEELDAQSRCGALLTAPASTAVVDLLRWIVDEVEMQLLNRRPPRRFVAR